MLSIAKRELRSLFTTMTAPIFCAVLTCVVGIYFIAYNLNGGYPYFSYTLESALFVLLIVVPLITMRSFAEERRQKTDQVLLTSPVRVSDIVLGKFLALAAVMALPTLLCCVCPLIIGSIGTSYPATDYATIFAFFCIGCLFISVGMYISSLTESQVIAAVVTIGALLLLFLWSGIVSLLPTAALGVAATLLLIVTALCAALYASTKNPAVTVIVWLVAAAVLAAVYFAAPDALAGFFSEYLSGFAVTEIIRNFAENSLFDLQGILKTLIVTGVMLFLTAQSIVKRRYS